MKRVKYIPAGPFIYYGLTAYKTYDVIKFRKGINVYLDEVEFYNEERLLVVYSTHTESGVLEFFDVTKYRNLVIDNILE